MRPAYSLVAVATALAAGLGLAGLTAPAVPPSPGPAGGPREVPVAQADAVCPDPVTDASTSTRVAVGAPGAAATAAGRVTVSPLGPAGPGQPSDQLDAPGSLDLRPAGGSRPLLVDAGAGLAPGLAAAMVSRADRGELRGLAATACSPPGTEFWFVGSGSVVGQRGRLYLTDASAAPALVDVALYGEDGRIDTPAGRGIPIEAGGQEVLKLDALAPDVDRLAVHVTVRQGRVSAALRDQQVDGLVPRGTDWVPAVPAPARRLALPGVPAGGGTRSLQVLVPGDSDAIVRVRVVAADGTTAPTDVDVVEATAGVVSEVDLTDALRGRPVTVLLRSDQPVVAGVLSRSDSSRGEPGDLAYAAPARPVTSGEPAVLAVPGAAAGTAAVLALSAPGPGAQVELSPLPGTPGHALLVRVPPESLRVVDLTDLGLPRDGSAGYAVAVTPADGSGPVVAAVVLTEKAEGGGYLSAWPLGPGRYRVPVPAVREDLSAGLAS